MAVVKLFLCFSIFLPARLLFFFVIACRSPRVTPARSSITTGSAGDPSRRATMTRKPEGKKESKDSATSKEKELERKSSIIISGDFLLPDGSARLIIARTIYTYIYVYISPVSPLARFHNRSRSCASCGSLVSQFVYPPQVRGA